MDTVRSGEAHSAAPLGPGPHAAPPELGPLVSPPGAGPHAAPPGLGPHAAPTRAGAACCSFAEAPPAGFGLRAAVRFAAAGAAAWYGAAALAATTPRPLSTPGLEVAAIGGLPWFADARSARLAAGGLLLLCLFAGWRDMPLTGRSPFSAVGWRVSPPLPPL